MNPTISKLTICGALLAGISLWAGMARKFDAENKFSYEPNVACIKGSPYGKILALAMQGPVDFYWHQGKTHEDEIILGADHKHGVDRENGSHDHAGHDHAGHDHAGHDHGADQHAEDCGCPAHDVAENRLPAEDEDPFRTRAKMQIKKLAAAAHRKTDGKPLSLAHQQYLQGVTEDKLRLAYELDPSNYTNYGNYHLFLASSSFGKSDADDDASLALARRTLEFCKQDQTDPASWVTAASAAYNIICHIGSHHEIYSIAEAKASLAEFDFCLSNYTRLRQEARERGSVISEERIKEMEERVRYLTSLRKAQGIYMKRVMSTKMANSSKHSSKIH